MLGSLFDNLIAADSIRDKWAIQDQIALENDRRQQALDQQGELIDAQVRYLNEKTDSLQRGDALIKIEADGLEPELEAFMWKIVERVQVRASDEGAEFLLGIT